MHPTIPTDPSVWEDPISLFVDSTTQKAEPDVLGYSLHNEQSIQMNDCDVIKRYISYYLLHSCAIRTTKMCSYYAVRTYLVISASPFIDRLTNLRTDANFSDTS
jgi:hypothetical protein